MMSPKSDYFRIEIFEKEAREKQDETPKSDYFRIEI